MAADYIPGADGAFDALLNIFLVVFLLIFIATAILTLASLPGWLKIPDKYKGKLFATLLLEVIGCVIGFVWIGIRIAERREGYEPRITDELLAGRWEWHYANRNWRTKARFEPVDGGYRFKATTFYTRNYADKLKEDGRVESHTIKSPIFTWISEPFRLSGEREIVLQCTQTIHEDIRNIVGPDSQEPGEYKRVIRLKPVVNLKGVWEGQEERALSGGIYLTRDIED